MIHLKANSISKNFSRYILMTTTEKFLYDNDLGIDAQNLSSDINVRKDENSTRRLFL